MATNLSLFFFEGDDVLTRFFSSWQPKSDWVGVY